MDCFVNNFLLWEYMVLRPFQIWEKTRSGYYYLPLITIMANVINGMDFPWTIAILNIFSKSKNSHLVLRIISHKIRTSWIIKISVLLIILLTDKNE